YLALGGRGVARVGRDLDQLAPPLEVAGEEVDLPATARAHVRHRAAPALQLDQHPRLEGVTEVRACGPVEDGDQALVDGVRLARIHHPLPLRGRLHPYESYEEAVLQVREELVDRVLRDRDALTLQRAVELLHAEGARGVPDQVTHQPPQARDVGDPVSFHHVTEDRHFYVVAE